MSARTRLFAGPVHGPTHRSAPTESIEIPVNPRRAGGDRAPPLPVDRGAQQRADVPKAWLPPTKFRAEIWGVSHGYRPLRDEREALSTTLASGASASAVARGGFGERQRSSPKCPATSDNPSVSLRLTDPFTQGSLGDGGSAGCGHPALRKHRNSQQSQAGRDGARPLQKCGEYAGG